MHVIGLVLNDAEELTHDCGVHVCGPEPMITVDAEPLMDVRGVTQLVANHG